MIDAEKFVHEVLRLWMEENGIKGTITIEKEVNANDNSYLET